MNKDYYITFIGNCQNKQHIKTTIIKTLKEDPLNYLDNNILLMSFGLDFNIISANNTFQHITGFSSAELLTMNFQQDFCKDMPLYIEDEINYQIKRQKPWNGEFLIPLKEKSNSWFNANIIPVNGEAGTVIGFTLMAILGKTQQDLISSQTSTESWMNAIFNDPEEANIFISKEGEIIDFNSKAYHFMEWYTFKELNIDEYISSYFGTEFSKTFKSIFDKVKVGQRQKFIRSFENSSGYSKIVEIELRPVISRENDIMGIIMKIIDISEGVALEKRIQLSEKKLNDIAFINAHEVRAPLASILGLINLLDLEPMDEDNKQILSHLKIAANKLEVIIHKVSESSYMGGFEKEH